MVLKSSILKNKNTSTRQGRLRNYQKISEEQKAIIISLKGTLTIKLQKEKAQGMNMKWKTFYDIYSYAVSEKRKHFYHEIEIALLLLIDQEIQSHHSININKEKIKQLIKSLIKTQETETVKINNLTKFKYSNHWMKPFIQSVNQKYKQPLKGSSNGNKTQITNSTMEKIAVYQQDTDSSQKNRMEEVSNTDQTISEQGNQMLLSLNDYKDSQFSEAYLYPSYDYQQNTDFFFKQSMDDVSHTDQSISEQGNLMLLRFNDYNDSQFSEVFIFPQDDY